MFKKKKTDIGIAQKKNLAQKVNIAPSITNPHQVKTYPMLIIVYFIREFIT